MAAQQQCNILCTLHNIRYDQNIATGETSPTSLLFISMAILLSHDNFHHLITFKKIQKKIRFLEKKVILSEKKSYLWKILDLWKHFRFLEKFYLLHLLHGWHGGRSWRPFGDHKITLNIFLQRAHICIFSRQKLSFLRLRENRLFLVLITLVLFKDYRIIR